MRKLLSFLTVLYLFTNFSVLDPAAGFRHGMYTLIGLVLALLALLLICVVLLKKRVKEKERELQMSF